MNPSMSLTKSQLYTLVLGLCFLAEVKKCIATIGASKTLSDTDTNIKRKLPRVHEGRVLTSVDAFPGEFPFFSQWGGCGATLIWDDILLTSASVSPINQRGRILNEQSLLSQFSHCLPLSCSPPLV